MFIETETTPNPATLKFLPGRDVLPGGTLDIRDIASAHQSPLAEALFAVPGVSSVFLGSDFVSVTKADGEWKHLKPALLGAIMDHYLSGAPIMVPGAATTSASSSTEDDGEFFDPADSETVDTIKELLETRVRPAVAGDGGDITFKGFRDGTVYLTMRGACSGCPSSTATLKHGIENLLRHFCPDVKAVEQSEA